MTNDAPASLSIAAETSPVCTPMFAETACPPSLTPLSIGSSVKGGAIHASTPTYEAALRLRAATNFLASSGDSIYIFQLAITRRFFMFANITRPTLLVWGAWPGADGARLVSFADTPAMPQCTRRG